MRYQECDNDNFENLDNNFHVSRGINSTLKNTKMAHTVLNCYNENEVFLAKNKSVADLLASVIHGYFLIRFTRVNISQIHSS